MSLERFYVKVVSENKEWRVTVHPATLDAAAISDELMCRLPAIAAAGQAFPRPPANAPQTGDPAVDALCQTTTWTDLQQVFSRIANRTPRQDLKDVSVFGQYLFASLVGEAGWTKIVSGLALGQGIELALYWPEVERDLSRLPWEMMRRPGAPAFLANDPNRTVAITRIVAGMMQQAPPIELPFRVLFAIGSALDDERIRPGAEYLGLLRYLKLKNQVIEVDHHLLTEANPDDLQRDVGDFKPDVVHLICHGDGEKLELRDDKGNPAWFSATQLISMLRPLGASQLPGVVVLNACYTANGRPAAQVHGPLAMQLVNLGVPIVVGMGGEVSDDACRLFTSGLYTALARGKSLPEATATARREGLLKMGQADSLVDWALPTLFMAEAVDPQPLVNTVAAALRRTFYDFARTIPVADDPPIFCGRTEILNDYRHLVDLTNQHKVLAAMVVDGVPSNGIVPDLPQYGKTRLLSELARRAQLDGHVPCIYLYKKTDDEGPPQLLFDLLLRIFRATEQARSRMGLPPPATSAVLDLMDCALTLGHKEPSDKTTDISGRRMQLLFKARSLGSDVPRLFQMGISETDMLNALSSDLVRLAEEAGVRFPGARVLVLLDEVHEYGEEAARGFARLLAEPFGWGTKEHPVPVIFAFSNPPNQATQAAKALEQMLQSKPASVVERRLVPYPEPTKDFTIYRDLLLHGKTRLLVRPDAKPAVYAKALENFWMVTRGVPSWCVIDKNVLFRAFIDTHEVDGVLRQATDDDVMQTIFP